MLAALSAVFLAASLILETAARSQIPLGRVLAVAGLAFLVAAVLAPYRPRSPEVNVSLHEHVPHPHLKHRAEHGPVKVADARPSGNPVSRFNTRAAVIVTRSVGTMYCAYLFCVLAFYGLPAGLHGGAAGFVQWASSQFIQLVLLPVILVGSAVLAETSDRMAKRQFDDVEALLHGQSEQAAHLAAQDEKILAILDRLDVTTEGGVKAVLDAVNTLASREVLEQKVHVEAAGPLPDAQVKQLVTAIQASLLRQAQQNGGTGRKGAGA